MFDRGQYSGGIYLGGQFSLSADVVAITRPPALTISLSDITNITPTSFEFNLPAGYDDGGAPITVIRVRRDFNTSAGAEVFTVGGGYTLGEPMLISNIDDGATVLLDVRLSNEAGVGSYSNKLTFDLPVSVPAPQIIQNFEPVIMEQNSGDIVFDLDDYISGAVTYTTDNAGAAVAGSIMTLSDDTLLDVDVQVTGTNSAGTSVSLSLSWDVIVAATTITVNPLPTLAGVTEILGDETQEQVRARLTNLGTATASNGADVELTINWLFSGAGDAQPFLEGQTVTGADFVYSTDGADDVTETVLFGTALVVAAAPVPAAILSAVTVTGQDVNDDLVITYTINKASNLDAVITSSATQPTVAQILAGQDHLGAAAADGLSLTWDVSGNPISTPIVDGIAAGTYYMHFVTDGSTTVVSSASFALDTSLPAAASLIDLPAGPTVITGYETPITQITDGIRLVQPPSGAKGEAYFPISEDLVVGTEYRLTGTYITSETAQRSLKLFIENTAPDATVRFSYETAANLPAGTYPIDLSITLSGTTQPVQLYVSSDFNPVGNLDLRNFVLEEVV